jgi:hypothetical protein
VSVFLLMLTISSMFSNEARKIIHKDSRKADVVKPQDTKATINMLKARVSDCH